MADTSTDFSGDPDIPEFLVLFRSACEALADLRVVLEKLWLIFSPADRSLAHLVWKSLISLLW